MKTFLILGLTGVFSFNNQVTAEEIDVARTSVELRTRDNVPVECGNFRRTVNIEVYDRYGERGKWSWQAQPVDVSYVSTNVNGTAEFSGRKIPNPYSNQKTRNPTVSVSFENVDAKLNDLCTDYKVAVDRHTKKSQDKWVRFGRGCGDDKGSLSLRCELVFTSQNLVEKHSLIKEALAAEWSEETRALAKELSEARIRDVSLVSKLVQNEKTDINARFKGDGNYRFETLWSAFISRFDPNNADERNLFQLFLQRNPHIRAKDLSLNTVLHNLISSVGGLATLQMLGSEIVDSDWLELNAEGETPFTRIAANAELPDLIDYLLSRSDLSKVINLKDAYGLTPLALFELLHPSNELTPRMKKHQLIHDKLLAAGARALK